MQSPIFALRQRKIDLRNSAKAISDEAGNRNLTPAEQASYDKTLKAIEANERELAEEEKRLAKAAGVPMSECAPVPHIGRGAEDVPDHRPRKVQGRVGIKTLAELFGDGGSDSGGFNSMEEYLRAVNFSTQLFDPRLRASMTESVPSQAGFLVPEQYSQQILQQALESAIVLPRAQMWPMTADVLKVPGVKDTDHSSSVLFGGVSAAWADELTTLADANIKTKLIALHAHKLGMLSLASSELVEDSNFESVLTAKLQDAAQWHLDNAFLYGDGAGKPLGMFNASNPSLVTVTHNTATPTDSVIYEDAVAMFGAMAPRCRQRAVWIINDSHLPAVLEFQLKVRNQANSDYVGGSATPVFTMNADGTGTLLGRPALFTEKAAAVGELGDFCFADISSYAVGMRREIRLERSTEAGFASDGVYWRLTVRVDGQPTWEAALKQKNGATVSPFVQLSAR